MLELLVFGAIAAIVATLFWGKKLIPPSGITGKIPAWGGRIAGSATVALVAAAIWWLIPWGLSPPAKMLTSFMSKEAYETLSWSLGVGLIALTSWLVWVIWGSSPVSTKKEPLSGVWLVWILAIVAAAVTAYFIAEMVMEKKAETEARLQIYKEVNLVAKQSELVEMTLTTVVNVSIPPVNISKEGDKRAWICTKVVRPNKLPFEPEFQSTGGGYTNHHQIVISEQSRQALLNNGTQTVTVFFWREIAKETDCK